MDLSKEKVIKFQEATHTVVPDREVLNVAMRIIENDRNDLGAIVDGDGVLTGVLAISDAVRAPDLLQKMAMSLKDANFHRKNPVTCKADESVETAIKKMDEENVSSCIIVDSQNRPIGLVTRKGIAAKIREGFRVQL